jgi:ferredoxin
MRIEVDLERCTGHGRCYDLQPEIFEPFDDDGRAQLLDSVDAADPKMHDGMVVAERACPEQALVWRGRPDYLQRDETRGSSNSESAGDLK